MCLGPERRISTRPDSGATIAVCGIAPGSRRGQPIEWSGSASCVPVRWSRDDTRTGRDAGLESGSGVSRRRSRGFPLSRKANWALPWTTSDPAPAATASSRNSPSRSPAPSPRARRAGSTGPSTSPEKRWRSSGCAGRRRRRSSTRPGGSASRRSRPGTAAVRELRGRAACGARGGEARSPRRGVLPPPSVLPAEADGDLVLRRDRGVLGSTENVSVYGAVPLVILNGEVDVGALRGLVELSGIRGDYRDVTGTFFDGGATVRPPVGGPAELFARYRYLRVDLERISIGAAFESNVRFHGLLAGIALRF